MQAYMLQAALICPDCAAEFMANTPKPDHVVQFPNSGEFDESTYDSDEWPKGPYGDGGGEADTPQHCDHCGEFLDNPLTGDGENYVIDAFRDYVDAGKGKLDVLVQWRNAYPFCWDHVEEITIPNVGGREAADRSPTEAPGGTRQWVVLTDCYASPSV